MASEFSRKLAFLRKEKKISQKEAASNLGVSQALLSHYEKGIRECGLEFLVKAADYYNVSADYLLGRSADPDGMTLTVEELPEADPAAKENSITAAGVLPVLNKKLMVNSLNIIFDLLAKSGSKELTKQVSNYFMVGLYKMFRILYKFNPNNNQSAFLIPENGIIASAEAHMKISESKIMRMMDDPSVNKEGMAISTEILTRSYPMFTPSFLTLIKNSEDSINKKIL